MGGAGLWWWVDELIDCRKSVCEMMKKRYSRRVKKESVEI